MRLSSDTVSLILDTTSLATVLGIEGLVLDHEGIRGYNDDDGIIVASLRDFGFEFESLGIARLLALRHKSTLLKKADGFTVDAVKHSHDDTVIEKLYFDCGKVNFEFRCALAKSIKDIPPNKETGKRVLNTKNPRFSFEFTEEDVKAVSEGKAAMRSTNMTIQNRDGILRFRFSDDTGDILNFRVDSDVSSDGEEDNFSLTINLKKMYPIFKLAAQGGNFTLNILKSNIIHIIIGELDVLVMPEVS